MAIVVQPKFAVPARAGQPVRFEKDDDGVIDIGWCEGALSDGRPFRAEMWAQDQISMLTFFFDRQGLEKLGDASLTALLEREGLIGFAADARRSVSARPFTDAAGKSLWSVNVVVGVEDETYLSASVAVFRYSRDGRPDCIFTPA